TEYCRNFERSLKANGIKKRSRTMALETTEAGLTRPRRLGLRDLRGNQKIKAYIEKANQQMAAIGYTEHGVRHAALVAAIARNTCTALGLDQRVAEMSAIAGYMHDIGCVVSRFYHPQIGATMTFTLLNEMGFE